MFDNLMHMAGDSGDPIGILMAASIIRDDAPWVYELAMEAYRAAKSGDADAIRHEMKRLRNFSEISRRTPFLEEFGMGDKESFMFSMEFPRMLEHILHRALDRRKAVSKRRTQRADSEPEVEPEQA